MNPDAGARRAQTWRSVHNLALLSFAASALTLWLSASHLSGAERALVTGAYLLIVHMGLVASAKIGMPSAVRGRMKYAFVPAAVVMAGGIFGKISVVWILSGAVAAAFGLIGSFWIARPVGKAGFLAAHLALALAGIFKIGRLDPLLTAWFGLSWVAAMHFTWNRAVFESVESDRFPPLKLMLKNLILLALVVACAFMPFAFLSTYMTPAPVAGAPPPASVKLDDANVIRSIQSMILIAAFALLMMAASYFRRSKKMRAKFLKIDPDTGMAVETEPSERPATPAIYVSTGLNGDVVHRFRRVLSGLQRAGYARKPSETVREYVRKIGGLFPALADDFKAAARVYQCARYGADDVTASDHERFAEHLSAVESRAPLK